VGLAVDIFTEMGTAINPLPGGEIVPALDRGLSTRLSSTTRPATLLGFPDVVKNCMLQGRKAVSGSRSCSTVQVRRLTGCAPYRLYAVRPPVPT
jgi:hypothetical protein